MKAIPLTQGQSALVDDQDFDWLSAWKWHAMRNQKAKRINYYAVRNVTIGKKRQTRIGMHQLIMGFPDCEIDHKDRNGLNNQRDNLRLATDSQQMSNRIGSNKPNAIGLRGVWRHGSRYQSSIKVNGKTKHLGTFDTAQDAARAYDRSAVRIFGEFAVLNYPLEALINHL